VSLDDALAARLREELAEPRARGGPVGAHTRQPTLVRSIAVPAAPVPYARATLIKC
jgi:hypothetical protein